MSATTIFVIVSCILIAYAIIFDLFYSNAKNYEDIPFVRMKATAYCYGTSKERKIGICATDSKHFGMIACIYEMNNDGTAGDFIGFYECIEMGGYKLKDKDEINIYNPSYEFCMNFGRKDVLVKFIEG